MRARVCAHARTWACSRRRLRKIAIVLWLVLPALLASDVGVSVGSEGTPSIEISNPVENAQIAGPVNLIEVSGLASPGPFTRQDLSLIHI